MAKNGNAHSSLLFLIREKGYATVNDLALAMGKRPNTVVNNLRYLAANGNYGSKFAHELVQFLKISEKQLRDILDGEGDRQRETPNATLSGYRVPEVIDGFRTASLDDFQYNYEIFALLVDSLGMHDKVIFFTAKRPPEFDDPTLRQKIHSAILRGVRFIYIYPETITNLAKVFGRYMVGYPEWKHLKEEHRKFQAEILNAIPSQLTRGDITETFGSAERKLFIDFAATPINAYDQVLLNPYHSYCIIERSGDPEAQGYVLESSFVGGHSQRIANLPSIWNPLPTMYAQTIAARASQLVKENDVWTDDAALSKKTGLMFYLLGLGDLVKNMEILQHRLKIMKYGDWGDRIRGKNILMLETSKGESPEE